MKKIMIGLTMVAVMAALIGFSVAQSDYSTRASWVLAKAPQGTPANIHSRLGVLVGHYIYDVDGALVTNTLKTIKEGEGNVTMPNNAMIRSNSLAFIDITTAANPTVCTGAVYLGSSLIYTGGFGSAGIYDIQIASDTKFTTNSELKIVCSLGIPTNALSLSVYVPYVLGN